MLLTAPGSSGAAPGEDREAIANLLDRRARAISGNDLEAFVSTLASEDPSFVRRQKRLFRSLAPLNLDSYRLEPRWDRYGDLGDLVAGRYDGDVALPVVEERYRFPGASAEVVEDLYYTFVRRGASWLIAADDDLAHLGFQSARHLWDFGPVEARPQRRFLILAHPCGDNCALERTIAALGDEALERVNRYWDFGRGRVAVLIPRSQGELTRMLQANFDLDDFVAFAVSSVDTRRGYEFVGPRIAVNPAAIAGRSRGNVLAILAHELLHVATRPASGPFVPIFVEEGFANFVGGDGARGVAATDAALAAGGFDGSLPADYEFTSGDGDAIFRSYQEGHSAVGYFVDEYGLAAFARFYRRLGRSDFRPGTTRFHLERALRATTGRGFRAFEREWASSIAAI